MAARSRYAMSSFAPIQDDALGALLRGDGNVWQHVHRCCS